MKRIVQSGNAFEARLLRAARSESSPSRAKERAAVAAAAVALGIDAGCGVEVGRGLSWSARKLLGLALGGGAVFVVATLARPAPTLAIDEAIAPRAVSGEADVAPRRVLDVGEAPAVVAPRRPAATHGALAIEEPSEMELVRRAKTALAANDAASALATLDAHDRRFPRGAFAEEADALRIHALAARGDSEAARAAAARFAASYPRSPYAERIRSIVR